MAISIEYLKETHRGSIIKFFGNSASAVSENATIEVEKLFGALNTSHSLLYPNHPDLTSVNGTALDHYDVTFYRAWYDIGSLNGGRVVLSWVGGGSTANSPIMSFAWSGDYNVEGNWITIKNPIIKNTGVKGNIIINTYDVTTFTLIIELVKDNSHYNSGEIENPNLHNYGKFGVTP